MTRFVPAILALMLVVTARLHADAKELRVYFVGNSLTASTTLDRVYELCGQRQIDLQFGSQISGGKSLLRHWNYLKEPTQKWVPIETSVPDGATFKPVEDPPADRMAVRPIRYGAYGAQVGRSRFTAVPVLHQGRFGSN